MVEAGAQLRINFAEWVGNIRQICKELATKTESYQGGYTNSIQRSIGGVWVRKVWSPWAIRDIAWKCVLCYRFNTSDSAGWVWCGCVDDHLLARSLVCLDCKTSWSKQHRE
jgi:hypothetical protein